MAVVMRSAAEALSQFDMYVVIRLAIFGSRLTVKAGKARSEQTTSGATRRTDILRVRRHVSKVPIAGK